jgi:hypothetical protein
MTANRDSRGRFVSADEAAATRLLERAVVRAVDMLRGITEERTPAGRVVYTYVAPDRAAVVAVLATATHAADLLLSEPTS